jgi:nucleoside-diphosphate-sugar epimerase
MKLLVLGGTLFLSRAIAEEGVRRGHEVVCAARGTSGTVPEGATLLKIDREAPNGLDALAGQKFDAVVDVAAMSYPWVRDALSAVGAEAGHWTFVSSINVYADAVAVGQNEDAPLHEPAQSGADQEVRIEHPDLYGSIKVASENAVREEMGDRAFIVRSGLIVGPGDRSDRFGYWVARISKGGRVVVPDSLEQPTQYVDVRDMAAWIVDAGSVPAGRGPGGHRRDGGPTGHRAGPGARGRTGEGRCPGVARRQVAAAVGAPGRLRLHGARPLPVGRRGLPAPPVRGDRRRRPRVRARTGAGP